MNRVHQRVAAIEALPEKDRERLWELVHRGDVLNDCLVDLEDTAPGPGCSERRREQLELLRTERDEAWAAANRLEAELGLPEPW